MKEILINLENKEAEYREAKVDLELTKAQLRINTDFPTAMNKAKPTEKDKEAWIKIETAEQEEQLARLKTEYHSFERTYQTLLRDKL